MSGLGRRSALSALDGIDVDVLIVGGGISGCSAAQQLAASGYRVLVIDKGDFASAASSRSSRLLHCGLRYLAPGRSPAEFLVRPDRLWTAISMAVRSLWTRREFLRTTPERLRVLDMAIPIYQGAAYSGWQVDVGATMLGALNLGGPPLHYQRQKPEIAAAAHPLVARLRAPETLASVFSFRDYQFHWPERICLDALLEARGHGALVRNYTEATALEQISNGGWRAVLEDRLASDVPVTVQARALLNLTGVWVDEVNRGAAPTAPPERKIVAVKGAHIAVQLPQECRGFGIAGLNREGEHFFCLPWGDLHYIGPTETVYEGDIEDVQPTEEDISFLLDEINHMMPALGLRRGDVELAWAGARPVSFDPNRAKGRRMPLSVLHDLGREGMADAMTVTWAAIMFHRPTARKLVRRVRRILRPSGEPTAVSYVAPAFPENTNTVALVPECPDITTGVLRHVAESEQPAHLVDILFRRTGLGWRTKLSPEAVRQAAEAVADILGWDEATVEEEIDAYRAHVRTQHLQG
jgi:glycerol-3-phosphate dehydrogenase